MVDKKLPLTGARALLEELCRERGEDYAGLSRLIGRNPAYIQQFVSRGTPRRLPERERSLLAQHLGIAEYLLGGDAAASAMAGLVPVFARRLENAEAATAADTDDREPDRLAQLGFAAPMLARLTASPAELLDLIEVSGDAMAPTLREGDHLLIDRGDGADSLRDGLYLIRGEERETVKRLTLHPLKSRVTVQSDNPAHADWPDIPLAKVTVIGRAIWLGRRLA